MPPHGGFAVGLERRVARLTGAANVRETTMFPRDLTRLAP
jgi:nondiscriminating aspartyl-tRNA synthetase